MNSSLRLMASLVVFLRQLRTPVRYVSGPYRRLQKGLAWEGETRSRGRQGNQLAQHIQTQDHDGRNGQPQAGNNGRQASTKRRQAPAHSRSSGSSPSQRSAHARA